MTSGFDRVMAEPGSLAARYALLDEWRASGDPRAALLENQLAYRESSWSERSSGSARHLETEIDRLIHTHGRAWAGRIAELVHEYVFHRGLVGEVTLSGEQFLDCAAELFELAPIQHVNLTRPISMSAIASSPWLAKLSSLHIDALGEAVDDLGALALAASPYLARLARLSLRNNAIMRTGVDALVNSRFLENARYIGLVGNPADPTPFVRDDGDGEYTAGRPALAVELERLHGPRRWLAVPTGHLPSWPGARDELAIVHDYVSDRVLADLERLALDVDRFSATTDEETVATAGAKRQRLLIELDVSGLLAGTETVRRRLAKHPALLGYHAAAVAMLEYFASASRIRLVATAIGSKATDGNVSLDWFRVPAGYTPPGVSPHDWLALCERNFIDPMPTGGGSRFVRLEGKMHQLLFRLEDGPKPRLWRAVLA